MWTIWLMGCNTPAVQVPRVPAPVVIAPTEFEALATADRLLDEASDRLQHRMVQEMGRRPPSEAITSCSIEADALTTPPPPTPGRVGRASKQLRNPANVAPAWVEVWLSAQPDGPFAGTGLRSVQGPADARVAQVLRPIVVQPQCLTCHGPAETLAADVRAVIEEKYPDDAALGYQVGDLRGAIWAEVHAITASAGAAVDQGS